MIKLKPATQVKVACYHCGEMCSNEHLILNDKNFCCLGCKTVYQLLQENNLCDYYSLHSFPGTAKIDVDNQRFSYLDIPEIEEKLITFSDGQQNHLTLFIPKIHCSSCIWLLENLHRLNTNILKSSVDFIKKEITIIYIKKGIPLSEIVSLLTQIGYEPLLNLDNLDKTETTKKNNRSTIIKIGLAGFCFGNIMMLSFPEYFSWGNFYELPHLKYFFAYLNLILSLPVLLYSASDFFQSAWKSIRFRYLNIDAPIALAILVTFLRSVYEIITQTGAGYLDSMSGIVFFMLIGRYFQNKTYETLSFERNYKSYFPISVTVKKDEKEESVIVSNIKAGQVIIVRNQEIIPCDSVLLSDITYVDYSFITGESNPVKKVKGDSIYAGAKQIKGSVELEVIKTTPQSYLTQLWNGEVKEKETYVDNINKYFTMSVLLIAFTSAFYWYLVDPSKILNAFTAVLIVACPCGLLLNSTFANGNILRIFGQHKFYLKNTEVIDKLAQVDTLVFDKTGTISQGSEMEFVGPPLSNNQYECIASIVSQSSHPLSKKIYTSLSGIKAHNVFDFEEYPGNGIKGIVNGDSIIIGSEFFITGKNSGSDNLKTSVFVMINGKILGFFSFKNKYRENLKDTLNKLTKLYSLKLLTGDNEGEKTRLKEYFNKETEFLFNKKPDEKLSYISQWQNSGKSVMMIGDGFNDSAALKQSNVGIAVTDNTNNFNPASHAILDGASIHKLPRFLNLAKLTKACIMATFIFSLTYNIIGLYFAVTATLIPLIAAILMPISSISIVILAISSTSLAAKKVGL
jgi:Cu+-exporting ATPase